MNLLFGHDKVVADWASKMFGSPLRNWYFAVGIINGDGKLVGAASFHGYNGSDIELCYYGPGSCSLGAWKGLLRFAFEELKVNRMTARVPRQNKKVLNSLPALGFKMEGVMRHYYGPVKRLDAIVFGLLEKDARKLIGPKK